MAGVVGVVVLSVIAYVFVKYRDRGQAIPEQTHGKPTLEIVLTIIPALILIGVAIPTVGTIMALNDTEDTECIINVTGQQWWWEIDYPAYGLETANEIHIPEDTEIRITLTSAPSSPRY